MDSRQFKTMIIPHHADMYRLAFTICRNTDDASDIVQDTFVKLWEHREELEKVENIHAYCLTAIKNQACSNIRRKKDTVSLDEAIEFASTTDSTISYEHSEELKILQTIVEQIPEKQRKVFTLSAFAQCSNNEISEMTGLSQVNVRTILSRTRRHIKTVFSNLTTISETHD